MADAQIIQLYLKVSDTEKSECSPLTSFDAVKNSTGETLSQVLGDVNSVLDAINGEII